MKRVNSRFLKIAMHIALMEIELLLLLGVVAFSILTQFKPTGIMTSAEGDVLRYRFADGQDDLLSRCRCVQVAFVTKQVPKAFSDPKLVLCDSVTAENRYAWHEIKVPIGTTAFRFDIVWKKEAQPSRTGPEVAEIWIGKKRLDWAAMRAMCEVYEPLTIPCYWFRPEFYYNLNRADVLMCFLLPVVISNVFLLAVWFIKRRSVS